VPIGRQGFCGLFHHLPTVHVDPTTTTPANPQYQPTNQPTNQPTTTSRCRRFLLDAHAHEPGFPVAVHPLNVADAHMVSFPAKAAGEREGGRWFDVT
jgi:hypothetical protein